MSQRLPFRVHAALLLVQVFFASLSVFGKEAMQYISWPALVTVRVTGSMLFFLAFGAVKGVEKVAPSHHKTLALYGFLGVAANQIQFLAGLSRTKALHATVLVTSIPVFAAALAVLLGRERFSLRKGAGVFLALLGALLLILGGQDLSPDLVTLQEGQVLGNLLILSNSLFYALYLVLSRDLLSRYQATTVVVWMFFYGFLETLAFDGLAALLSPEEARASWEGLLTAPAVAWQLIAIVVLITVLAYILNSWALRFAPSSLVAIYIYLQPLAAALLAWVRLGEHASWHDLAAAALIVAGVTLVGRARPTAVER